MTRLTAGRQFFSSFGPVLAALLLAVPIPAQDSAAKQQQQERPDKWAQPLDQPGVPNLHRVSKALYRSAQPTAEGMAALKALGIETIVNLRSFHSDRRLIGSTGMAYEHIYMKAWHPEEKELVRFLQIVSNPKRTPVLVHCQHGADRTGLMCATYRIVIQNWTKDEAIQEMVDGGYGFHPLWSNLVDWVRRLDPEDLRAKAGISPPAES